jgi:hypothetical protein
MVIARAVIIMRSVNIGRPVIGSGRIIGWGGINRIGNTTRQTGCCHDQHEAKAPSAGKLADQLPDL